MQSRWLALASVLLVSCAQDAPSDSPPYLAARVQACDVSKIAIKSVEAGFVDECRASSCPYLRGVAVLNNGCQTPVGVQVKITVYNESGAPMATDELWPASTRNIPPGDYTFSIDQWIDYQPGMARFELQPVDVREWN